MPPNGQLAESARRCQLNLGCSNPGIFLSTQETSKSTPNTRDYSSSGWIAKKRPPFWNHTKRKLPSSQCHFHSAVADPGNLKGVRTTRTKDRVGTQSYDSVSVDVQKDSPRPRSASIERWELLRRRECDRDGCESQDAQIGQGRKNWINENCRPQ